MRTRQVPRTVFEYHYEPISDEEMEQQKAFEAAMQTLKEAKDDDAKKKAQVLIRDHLVKQFERDLVHREKELANVEERLKSLRQQLERRKVSKDDIVSLRLKTIVNNAEGLGFPGDDGAHGEKPISAGLNSFFTPLGEPDSNDSLRRPRLTKDSEGR